MKSKTALIALAFLAGMAPSHSTYADQDTDRTHIAADDLDPHLSQVTAEAVINEIDVEARTVKVTHEPIPDIGWPSMTMDMKVGELVELEKFEPGDSVVIHMALGADDIYFIAKIVPNSSPDSTEA